MERPQRFSSIAPWRERKTNSRTLLPFAGNRAPIAYPQVTFGVGLSAYASSFKGVDRAFAAIEDSIRNSGYAIASSSGDGSGAMYLLTLGVTAGPRLGVSLQVGATSDGDREVRMAGGIVWARWAEPEQVYSFAAGAGGGVYRFRLARRYGVRVSPDDAGTYTVLDFVRFSGDGPYATIAARGAVRVLPRLSLEATLQYLGMGDVSSELQGVGRQSVNVSGFVTGLSIVVTL